MSLKQINFFSDLITNIDVQYMNNLLRKKKHVKTLVPKVGKVYLVRFGINSIISKNSVFLSKSFLGRCIFLRRKNSNSGLFCLRNIYNRYPIEFRFFFRSPFIFKIREIEKVKKKYRRNNLNYFRHLSVFKSRV
jgi:ribosomal protein L19